MLAIAASATRVPARLVRDLSRFGKITLVVWALVSTGYYPRPPLEMALVYTTTVAAMFGVLAIAASAVLARGSKKLRASRIAIEDGRLTIEHDGRAHAYDVWRDVTNAFGYENATEVHTRDGTAWAFVHASAEEAGALVAKLGFGVGGRRATFDTNLPFAIAARIGYVFLAFCAACFVSMPIAILGFRGFENTLPIALTAALYQLFRFLMKKPVVTVGVDGVVVEHRWSTRFVAARQLAGVAVAQSTGHALITLRGGGSLEVDGPNVFREAALAALIQALAAREATPPTVALEREGRSVRAWRDHLRDAVVGGYRVAAGSLEALAEQLTSRTATPEQRVGAALALRVADVEAGASRVRVAADGCADTRLRAALEAAAAEEIDDAKLERALSRLAK